MDIKTVKQYSLPAAATDCSILNQIKNCFDFGGFNNSRERERKKALKNDDEHEESLPHNSALKTHINHRKSDPINPPSPHYY